MVKSYDGSRSIPASSDKNKSHCDCSMSFILDHWKHLLIGGISVLVLIVSVFLITFFAVRGSLDCESGFGTRNKIIVTRFSDYTSSTFSSSIGTESSVRTTASTGLLVFSTSKLFHFPAIPSTVSTQKQFPTSLNLSSTAVYSTTPGKFRSGNFCSIVWLSSSSSNLY